MEPSDGTAAAVLGQLKDEREGCEGRLSLGSKLFKKVRREFSMPVVSPEPGASPRLRGVRSADSDRRRGMTDTDKFHPSHSNQMSPMASRRNSMLFAKTWRGRRMPEDGATLKALPSDDSFASDGEMSPQRSTGTPGANDSSRQLNLLWEDDPGSKSSVFLSLLNIENAT